MRTGRNEAWKEEARWGEDAGWTWDRWQQAEDDARIPCKSQKSGAKSQARREGEREKGGGAREWSTNQGRHAEGKKRRWTEKEDLPLKKTESVTCLSRQVGMFPELLEEYQSKPCYIGFYASAEETQTRIKRFGSESRGRIQASARWRERSAAGGFSRLVQR